MELRDVGRLPKTYDEAEAMGLMKGGEFTGCPFCGCRTVERRNAAYDECHGIVLAEYDAHCASCGALLGAWDHGAPFPSYL